MNLAEYKRQAQEIAEILMNFSGKEEEAEEFAKTLMEKYREFGEFNAKALECQNLAEFKNLASANGMEFESDEEANELFLGLSKGKEEVEKAILSAEEMAAVSGGATAKNNAFDSLKVSRNINEQGGQNVYYLNQVDENVTPGLILMYGGMVIGVLGALIGAATMLYDFSGRGDGATSSTENIDVFLESTGLLGMIAGYVAHNVGWLSR